MFYLHSLTLCKAECKTFTFFLTEKPKIYKRVSPKIFRAARIPQGKRRIFAVARWRKFFVSSENLRYVLPFLNTALCNRSPPDIFTNALSCASRCGIITQEVPTKGWWKSHDRSSKSAERTANTIEKNDDRRRAQRAHLEGRPRLQSHLSRRRAVSPRRRRLSVAASGGSLASGSAKSSQTDRPTGISTQQQTTLDII